MPGVSVEQAAQHFGVDRSTVRRWIQAGCPCAELGSIGRGRGSTLILSEVEQWRVSQSVPTFAARAEADVLTIVEQALMDALKRDDLARCAKISDMQAALVVLRIFERCYRNVKREPLEAQHVPPQLRHLCAIYLDSVERGTFQRR